MYSGYVCIFYQEPDRQYVQYVWTIENLREPWGDFLIHTKYEGILLYNIISYILYYDSVSGTVQRSTVQFREENVISGYDSDFYTRLKYLDYLLEEKTKKREQFILFDARPRNLVWGLLCTVSELRAETPEHFISFHSLSHSFWVLEQILKHFL